MTPIQKAIQLKAKSRKVPVPAKIITNRDYLNLGSDYVISTEERVSYPRGAKMKIRLLSPASPPAESPGAVLVPPVKSPGQENHILINMKTSIIKISREDENVSTRGVTVNSTDFKNMLAALKRANQWVSTQMPDLHATEADLLDSTFNFLINQLHAPGDSIESPIENSPTRPKNPNRIPERKDSLRSISSTTSTYNTLPYKLNSAPVSNSSTRVGSEFLNSYHSATRILKTLSYKPHPESPPMRYKGEQY